MAIPGEKAIQMVRNAHGQATQLDIAVTAVVVDQSGRMIALGRMDKARPITVEIALNKAYTAASFQQPTKDLAGCWKRSDEHTSELQSLRHLVCRLLPVKKKIKH